MKALVPLAEGVEEMEAVILVDVWRRAGWTVTTAGTTPGPVRASRGVALVPDLEWSEIVPDRYDLLALPGGGGGVERLCAHEGVLEAVRRFDAPDKRLAAICAGPLVLQAAGVLAGRRVTCHPDVAGRLTATPRLDDRVVEDGRLITSQGPGTAMAFALAVVAAVEGRARADALARAMVL